ncbi:sensor histidine kinase [Curtobacterium sp. RRHDQ10]|uniref:sensor histidine kinase n=1 Tax=Curtobacterium phyllosphaerae TaxID=3413379 RepID=UPI003BF45123
MTDQTPPVRPAATWLRSRPALLRFVRGVTVFVVAVVAITLAHQLPWYPSRIDYYVWTAAISAVAIGFGRRYPLPLLLGTAVVVGWPAWSFEVSEVRLIPLGIAGFLAASGGVRVVVTLPVVAASAVSAMVPYWFWFAPGTDRLREVLAVENPSIRALAFCIVLAAVLLGRASFVQARDATELRRRNSELERLRESDRARIANEERSAIAREVHDVVAHHIAAMVIRAQGAARLADTRPEELRSTVEWIASSGQEALTAMRNVVRVLRGSASGGTTPGGSTEAPLRLDHALDDVLARVRGAGLDVLAEIEVPHGLSAMQEFAVLRVCQEALTNVLIHSDGTRVRVMVITLADALLLQVQDDGAARPASDGSAPGRAGVLGSGGAGIRGMQERAEAVGGSLIAGPVQHGWRVELVLPLRDQRTAPTRAPETTAPIAPIAPPAPSAPTALPAASAASAERTRTA